MEAIVKVKDVSKTYSGYTSKTQALNHLSVQIEPGTFTCIVGKSGCGKSTLLNVIGGLLEVDTGEVIVQKQCITEFSKKKRMKFRRKHVGFIFQFFNLLQEQTVLENIMLPFDLNHEKPDKRFIQELMEYLDIHTIANKFPFELSGGQQQRVAIARAIARKPSIILADEPTGNLDQENTLKVMRLLKECQAYYHQTIIMVTHDIDLAKHADALIYMEDGQVKQYEKK
ncbi:MAG: ABC transporter ATP-binding protein [Bacillota bacterium]|nr:ABC transporter ATP-binding protein [Bacillota bacterium]